MHSARHAWSCDLFRRLSLIGRANVMTENTLRTHLDRPDDEQPVVIVKQRRQRRRVDDRPTTRYCPMRCADEHYACRCGDTLSSISSETEKARQQRHGRTNGRDAALVSNSGPASADDHLIWRGWAMLWLGAAAALAAAAASEAWLCSSPPNLPGHRALHHRLPVPPGSKQAPRRLQLSQPPRPAPHPSVHVLFAAKKESCLWIQGSVGRRRWLIDVAGRWKSETTRLEHNTAVVSTDRHIRHKEKYWC